MTDWIYLVNRHSSYDSPIEVIAVCSLLQLAQDVIDKDKEDNKVSSVEYRYSISVWELNGGQYVAVGEEMQ
jgi:hypothetical protein